MSHTIPGGGGSASDDAVAALQSMKGTLEGDLTNALNNVKVQGNILANGQSWTGRYANEFKNNWESNDRAAIQKVLDDLNRIHEAVSRVVNDILHSAGNQ